MKLSNAIKNCILIIIIILIGHFILKHTINTKDLYSLNNNINEEFVDTTCKINLNNNNDNLNKKIKANCDILQDKTDFLIINEYEEENQMNNGKITDSLSAFDAYDFTI